MKQNSGYEEEKREGLDKDTIEMGFHLDWDKGLIPLFEYNYNNIVSYMPLSLHLIYIDIYLEYYILLSKDRYITE